MRQVYSDPETQFGFFPFDGVPGRIARAVMSFYNRRLAALAKKRLANGTYGAANAGWRLMVGGFVPDASVLKLVRQGHLAAAEGGNPHRLQRPPAGGHAAPARPEPSVAA